MKKEGSADISSGFSGLGLFFSLAPKAMQALTIKNYFGHETDLGVV